MRTLCLFWCKNQRYSSLRCRDRRVAESKKAESLRTLCLCGVRIRVCEGGDAAVLETSLWVVCACSGEKSSDILEFTKLAAR